MKVYHVRLDHVDKALIRLETSIAKVAETLNLVQGEDWYVVSGNFNSLLVIERGELLKDKRFKRIAKRHNFEIIEKEV